MECTRHTAYIVYLSDGTCTRKQFELESFSWEHAVVVAMYRGFAARTLCSPYYTAENWRAAYVETIFSFPNEAEWEVPDHIHLFNTLSPPLIEPHSPGHPNTSRIPSTGEFSRPRRCSRCKTVGHTRQFCISQVPLNDSQSIVYFH
ncbi:uncharacterized protein LOC111408633 [Olea europaea var. sylvestris]|uniref:uncharacterized protein LOC111408633 n=1 Tax=Olea europaea var. sylvestris TaxID=158386 RepID=UPI000C1D4728|nr:uncharacterized protein LOC111408633 [Olea europaea var. sylvestris]